MDVVGLIRVLDNPEDLHYYGLLVYTLFRHKLRQKMEGLRNFFLADTQKTAHNHRVYVTAESPSLALGFNATNKLPQETTSNSPEKELKASSAPFQSAIEGSDSINEAASGDQKCLSVSLYWTLVVTLALLVTLQITALGVYLVDRLLLDKLITKRMHHLLRY